MNISAWFCAIGIPNAAVEANELKGSTGVPVADVESATKILGPVLIFWILTACIPPVDGLIPPVDADVTLTITVGLTG